jgi:hypothetical protein
VIYVMTHDSIGLGEDGPTHQPIEHLASFRAMPNMLMMRPCGGNETAGAYKVAVQSRKRPTTIALSRQGMPNLPGCSVEGVEKGAYIVQDCEGQPDVIIIGTGSELPMAIEAADKLKGEAKVGGVWLCLCVGGCVCAGDRRVYVGLGAMGWGAALHAEGVQRGQRLCKSTNGSDKTNSCSVEWEQPRVAALLLVQLCFDGFST